MEQKQYYCVTTRRFTLRCGHKDWLERTQTFYNEVIFFYYNLFLRLEEENPGCLTGQSGRQAMRRLETLTIVGREKKPVPCPLPWDKVPLYFRRSAINAASASARSYLGSRRAGLPAGKAGCFQKGVTFYKGMYRELSSGGVSLKVWNGERWSWLHCRLSGNKLPEEAEALSPSVALAPQGAFLLVPVRERVSDGRKAKERMREGGGICSVQFANKDFFAVGVAMDGEGSQKAVHFFRGGARYRQLCREMTGKIKISETAMGLCGAADGEVGESALRSDGNTEGGVVCQTASNTQDGPICQKADRAEERPIRQEADRAEERIICQKAGRAEERIICQEADRTEESPIRQAVLSNREEKVNNRYWMKLKHISEYYAHCVSREIVEFCQNQKAEILVLPKYDAKFTKYVMCRVGNWSALHLSLKIRELVRYKAWKAGIVVLEVNPGGTSAYCAQCGAEVKKKGDEFECPNGHRGSRQLNTARNLGRKCLRSFGKEMV